MNLLKVLLLTLLLAGCAGTPATKTITSPDRFPRASELPDSWQLTGRISLTQGEAGWHAGVDWAEQADSFRLRLSGPLGQGGFLLTGNAGGVLLRDSSQRVYAAADTGALLAQVTGWTLPVAGLRYWVLGIPAPNADFEAEVDAAGRLERLVQDGWTIRYSRYHPAADGRWPARLGLARDDISVRLVIDQWQFGELPASVP